MSFCKRRTAYLSNTFRRVWFANIRNFCVRCAKASKSLRKIKDTMVVDKVTKDMLFKLNVGDQKVFTLPVLWTWVIAGAALVVALAWFLVWYLKFNKSQK